LHTDKITLSYITVHLYVSVALAHLMCLCWLIT